MKSKTQKTRKINSFIYFTLSSFSSPSTAFVEELIVVSEVVTTSEVVSVAACVSVGFDSVLSSVVAPATAFSVSSSVP
jgi:hypothetical protein